MSDVIRLHALQFYARHGADPEERVLGQRFEVDLALHLDLRAAGRGDDLERTANYREAYRLVAEVMATPSLLIEAVAERCATAILRALPVDAVTVTVRKPSVPLGGVVGYAEVEITRTRADLV
ncbi:MAG: dihydroneopterin aldolase [Armatimonadetes bacterium]|nr:dihydroneopterin aldolase [Armatimonadota bacterium]